MANKRGPLSKVEIFYVVEHIKIGKDINEIALDLDRPIKSIEKYIKKSQPTKSSQKAQQANTISPRLTAGDQFIKRSGTVVMTENASTISDSRVKSISSRNQSCITKAKSDE